MIVTRGYGPTDQLIITRGFGISFVVEIVGIAEAVCTYIAKARAFDFMARTR